MRGACATLVLLLLAGCSEMGPFEGPQPSADEHSLCYSRRATTPDQLHELATTACGSGSPRYLRQNLDFSACPLLVPERLAFACGPA